MYKVVRNYELFEANFHVVDEDGDVVGHFHGKSAAEKYAERLTEEDFKIGASEEYL